MKKNEKAIIEPKLNELELYYVADRKVKITTLKELQTLNKTELVKKMSELGIKTPMASLYTREEMYEIVEDFAEENLEKIKKLIKNNPVLATFNNVLFSPEHLILKWYEYIEDLKTNQKEVKIKSGGELNKIIYHYKAPKVKEFCLKIGLLPSKWAELKREDKFSESIEFIETMEEVISVNLTERGYIDGKLANTLLSKFGYSSKSETKLTADVNIKPLFHDILAKTFEGEKKK